MGLPDDFEEQSLYTSDQWYVHDLIEVDEHRVVAVTDTTKIGAIVEAQKPWPGQPKHVPGIVMVQITGTLGNLHAVYGLHLKMTEGWVGFGTNIHEARFRNIGTVGPPMKVTLEVQRMRRLKGQVFGTYTFVFEQGEKPIYQSKQTAIWTQQTAT